MPTRSLLDWTASPAAASSPLPPLAALSRKSWPVGLLPVRELAEDLARRGLAYRRSYGFTVLGERVDDSEAARMASSVLAQAAEELAPSAARSVRLYADLGALDDETDRLQAAAHAEAADYGAAEELFLASSVGVRALARGLRSALESSSALSLDVREAAVLADIWADHRAALTSTSHDVRASPGARAALLKSLRAALPAPSDLDELLPGPAPEDVLEPFLAALDGEDKLRRSALLSRYNVAGRPGDLADADLRDLAAARWGLPGKFQGIYTYRPARASRR